MVYLHVPGLGHIIAAAIAAFVLGYAIVWLVDRYVFRQVTDDRIAGIALACALAFILMMTGASLVEARLAPGLTDSIFIVPHYRYALSFLFGIAGAGVLRTKLYSREYEANDDQLYFAPDYDDQSLYDAEVLTWDQKNAGRNYFRRHWSGHLSLPVSYWVNGALFSILALGAVRMLTGRLESSEASLQVLAGIAVVYIAVSTLLWVWSSVGIWRSAYWHRRRGGSAAWGLAARSLVLLSATATVFESKDLGLQAAEYGQLAMGRDSLGKGADVQVSSDGHSLILRGTIVQGTARRFRYVLEGAPSVREVILTSEGGRMLEAERMGRSIRERKLDTRVDDHCMSACITLLLAGDMRTAPHLAKVGFHQPSFPGTSAAEMRVSTEKLRNDYLAAGVDGAFLWRALATPAEDMWFPTWDQLLDANVLTQPEIIVGGSAADRDRANKVGMDSLSGRRLVRDLAAMAAETNKEGPRRIDEVTTVDGARARGFTFTTLFTVKGRVDPVFGRRSLRPLLRADVCGNPGYSAAVHDGATFLFSYRDGAGKQLFEISIDSCA